jgi:hypothetical protein
MSRFFTNSPYADTYDNAVDKSAWLKETCSGSYDWRAPKDAPQYTMADVERSDKLIEAGAPGSMCPVSAGGTHVSRHDLAVSQESAVAYEHLGRVRTSVVEVLPQRPVALITTEPCTTTADVGDDGGCCVESVSEPLQASAILEAFDKNTKYGPCVGIPRSQRWARAQRLNLSPPPEVMAIIEASHDELIERDIFCTHNRMLRIGTRWAE